MTARSGALRTTIQIGEAAQRAAVSVDAIRFYERRALLPRAPRTAGRYRLYTADDVGRLSFIKQMQSLGFSLKEVKQLLDLRDCGRYACREVRDFLKVKLSKVQSKISELQKLEGELRQDLEKCNNQLKHKERQARGQCPILSAHKDFPC